MSARVAFAALFVLAGCFHSESSGNDLLELADPMSTDPSADTALAVLNGVLAIYDQHLAGRKTGSDDFNAPCPNGGMVRVEGSTSYDSYHGLTRVDLSYTFTDCAISQAAPSVALTLGPGSLREIGSFDSFGYVSESFLGQLDYRGTVRGQPVSRAGCALSINRGISGLYPSAYRSVSGALCGASFSFTPAGYNFYDDGGVDAEAD